MGVLLRGTLLTTKRMTRQRQLFAGNGEKIENRIICATRAESVDECIDPCDMCYREVAC